MLIPVSLLFLAGAVWAFFWAINHDQFEDLETDRKMHVIPEYLRAQYLNVTSNHIEALRKGMNAVQIDYTLMDTSKPLDAGLFSYLAARAHTL